MRIFTAEIPRTGLRAVLAPRAGWLRGFRVPRPPSFPASPAGRGASLPLWC